MPIKWSLNPRDFAPAVQFIMSLRLRAEHGVEMPGFSDDELNNVHCLAGTTKVTPGQCRGK